MIRVVVTAPAQEGRVHYRIETPGTRLALPYNGFAADPLEDACAKLRSMGAADEGSMVELYDSLNANRWTRRMPLGSAQQRTVAEIAERVAYNDEADKTIAETAEQLASGGTLAKPKARRRRKRKSPKPPAGKGRAAPKPTKKAKSRPKRKPVKSASRRR